MKPQIDFIADLGKTLEPRMHTEEHGRIPEAEDIRLEDKKHPQRALGNHLRTV